MPGSFIIRPVEANLTHNTDLLRKMSPYCSVSAGGAKIKGQICKHGGKHPHWNDAITIPATNQSQVLVELMDKDKITKDDNIGSLMLDLREVQALGQVSKWYPLTYKNKAAGEILLETVYQPSADYGAQNQLYQQGQQFASAGVAGQNQYSQQGQQYGYGGIAGQNQYYQQEQYRGAGVTNDLSNHHNVWTEQHQVVQPHTFVKEVEVIETRPALKEVEVMEPVKVLKEVPYTQAVPVIKQIEVTEPQVVVKDIEVMEPRLVTKTIQVVENVPVKRQVEVVEMRNAVQEVETVEPQTFTKQVEVTEYVPVRKQVEVTQPVTLKKAVEFVEPVITTQTITKEAREAVIIDEQVTTTVGPASVVGISAEYGYIQNYGEVSLGERQRIGGLQRWVGYETIFNGLNDQERLFEQQRLSRLSEQEWLRERERLMALGEQQRLLEQRNTYKTYYSTNRPGGFSNAGYSNVGYSNTGYSTGGLSSGHKRWHGFEHLFGGLNEKERQFEQERWNRLSEQEWLQEQKRLSAFNDQDRLLEQRRLYNDYLQNGGFSTFKKTTEVVEKTTQGAPSLIQGNQTFAQGSQNLIKGGENFVASQNRFIC